MLCYLWPASQSESWGSLFRAPNPRWGYWWATTLGGSAVEIRASRRRAKDEGVKAALWNEERDSADHGPSLFFFFLHHRYYVFKRWSLRCSETVEKERASLILVWPAKSSDQKLHRTNKSGNGGNFLFSWFEIMTEMVVQVGSIPSQIGSEFCLKIRLLLDNLLCPTLSKEGGRIPIAFKSQKHPIDFLWRWKVNFSENQSRSNPWLPDLTYDYLLSAMLIKKPMHRGPFCAGADKCWHNMADSFLFFFM